MRSLNELIAGDSAWPLVEEWLSGAVHPVEVLPPAADAAEALLAVQVTTRSPMGAVILNSAGILVASGWLRFLGSGGHPKLQRSLPRWNEGRAEGFCICADDVVGGYFALNGGALGAKMGEVFYFAPDTLEWMGLGIGYTDFFTWSLTSALDQFYADLRWPGWQQEAEAATGDQVFSIYPFLWAEGEPLEKRSRRLIPATEHFDWQQDMRRQLGAR